MAHSAQCCALSPNGSDRAVAAYRAVFLYRQPPAGAAVAADTVILSCRAVAVAVIDLVKILVI